MAEGLFIRIVHIGPETGSILLADIKDTTNDVSTARKTPVYIPVSGTIDIAYTSSSGLSFESGDIRGHIDNGSITAEIRTGAGWVGGGGGGLPVLPGEVGSALVEDPIGTLVFRRLTEDDILPTWAISSFGLTGDALIEVGDTETTPGFSASYVRTPPASAILTDTNGTPSKDVTSTPTSFTSNGVFSKSSYNDSVVFTLTATDTLTGAVDVDTATMRWVQNVFWGVAADGLSTEGDIEGLSNSALATSRARSIAVNPGAGEHIYYAYRTAYGAATFTVGGFVGGFVLVLSTISVTNPFGFTEDYSLYKSVQANLGSTTVVVS